MGANHPGEIARLAAMAAPRVGVITQIAPAHLEGFGSIEGVARAKGELFSSLPSDGVGIFDAACDFTALWKELLGGRRQLRFGMDVDAEVMVRHRSRDDGELLSLQTPIGALEVLLPLLGRHNVVNAAAAAAAAIAMDIGADAIVAGLSQMQPVAGRLAPRARSARRAHFGR